MELPSLNLEDDAIKTKVINVLSSLYIDDSTCKKLITVFEDEIEKGIMFYNIFLYSIIDSPLIRYEAWFAEIQLTDGEYLYPRTVR